MHQVLVRQKSNYILHSTNIDNNHNFISIISQTFTWFLKEKVNKILSNLMNVNTVMQLTLDWSVRRVRILILIMHHLCCYRDALEVQIERPVGNTYFTVIIYSSFNKRKQVIKYLAETLNNASNSHSMHVPVCCQSTHFTFSWYAAFTVLTNSVFMHFVWFSQ